MTSVASIQRVVEQLWPAAGAEDWDAVGLIAGSPDDTARRVTLAVDATIESAEEALENDADMLLVHHPLLLRGVSSIAADTPKGAVVTMLLRGRCSLLAAHTNADIVERGTSAELARALGLRNAVALDGSDTGIGSVGDLSEAITLGEFAELVAAAVPATSSGIRVAGDRSRPVQRIALCGGAGDSYLQEPAVLDADVFLTGDLRHHPASDARERYRLGRGPALVDVSHWAAESLWLQAARQQLEAALPHLEVRISTVSTDPWDFRIEQEQQ